jgi:GNAT superfamily N-acetyltransferase
MPSQPFGLSRYELRAAPRPLVLEAIEVEAAGRMAEAIARMDPWRTLAISPGQLAETFAQGDPQLHRWTIRHDQRDAGAVVIRHPWLYGPYLALLALTPEHQGAGIGGAVLDWMGNEARGTAGNIWACVSAFNARARQFYERHGFEAVGVLDDLVRPGFAEVLIRKRLT